MDLSRNPLWDERGEFRRGCTVGEALSWLTARSEERRVGKECRL